MTTYLKCTEKDVIKPDDVPRDWGKGLLKIVNKLCTVSNRRGLTVKINLLHTHILRQYFVLNLVFFFCAIMFYSIIV